MSHRTVRERFNSTDSNAASQGDELDLLSVEFAHAIRNLTRVFKDNNPEIELQPQQILECCRVAVSSVLAENFSRQVSREVIVKLDDTDKKEQGEQPPAKKKLVRGYIDGCFDIMHSGHYNAIRQAKQLCDILVVGVHSDKEILKHKGPPVMDEDERLATVRACKWCDEIVLDTPYDPSVELLDALNADFVVHGDDTSTTQDGNDAYAGVRNAGRLRVIKRTEGVSTTDLVGRLLLLTKHHHIKGEGRGMDSPSGGPVTSSLVHKLPELSLSNNPSPVRKPREPSVEAKHYSEGLSSFLPTTWRIASFSNNRTPKADDTVVYIDGSFDLFHVGHIETIEKAKALGSFLFVGIHDDTTVNKHKGKNYPIMNLHERVLNVLSCKYVDEVVIGAPWTITKDMVTTFNIAKVVSGSNSKMSEDENKYTGNNDPYKVPKELGIYCEVQTERGLSTEDVVDRIINNRTKYQKRNKKRVGKDVNYLSNKAFVAEL